MSYGKKLFRSSTRAIDAQNVYDDTEGKLQSEVNADLKTALNNKILKATSAVTPQTTQQTYTLSGLTASHELIRWNFKSGNNDAPENYSNVDLTWTTGSNQWTLVSSGSTSLTCQPVFAIPE